MFVDDFYNCLFVVFPMN